VTVERAELQARRIIVDWVAPGASVLELGCGSGELLEALTREKQVRAQGVETEGDFVGVCVRKGLNVLHEAVEESLRDYGERAFDFAIFNGSLQRVAGRPDVAIQDALRVGRSVIIRFSNFAHYRARLQMFFGGRTPVTPSLPYEWFDTPNLHFLSVADFREYCAARGIAMERRSFLGESRPVRFLPNVTALTGVFMISRAAS